MSRQVEHDGQHTLLVRFSFDRELVDRIKSLPNRRWIATERLWAVPEDDVVLLVDLVADAGFEFDAATRLRYETHSGSKCPGRPQTTAIPDLPLFAGVEPEPLETSAKETTDLSIGELNEQVRRLLAGAFPTPVWLVGEISGFNKSAHRKHVGFELIERAADGNPTTKVSAILFESTRREIERLLSRAGDPFRLEDEISVRFEVRVDLQVRWGQYRVVVERLDPNYTLGEAARRREEIVRELTQAGLHNVNRALELPALPLRVGLITSLGSDAYNDVLRSLRESGYAFDVSVHGARVQGAATEPSVLNALDWFRRRSEDFDVVLICRGGGSRTDLTWFDTELLGRAVALFPVPVVVGIGHEQDQSVLDAVARSCKTPTAAAGVLVERVSQALARTEESGAAVLTAAAGEIDAQSLESTRRGGRLATAAGHRLILVRSRLELVERQTGSASRAKLLTARGQLGAWARRIPREARLRVDRSRADLGLALRSLTRSARGQAGRGGATLRRAVAGLPQAARRALALAGERLDTRGRRLALVDPRRVVERGYAILRRGDATVLVDAAHAERGETLVAELKHGRLRVTADKMEPPTGR